MKLNNKGFAITAVLYGLLILFVFFVSAYLLALSAKKNSIDSLIENIENEYKNITLVEHINNLYATATKTTVNNNSIEYNYAPSVHLMNDRFGSSEVQADNGNIRYYGFNPNNYIDIGDVTKKDSTFRKWVEIFQLTGGTEEEINQMIPDQDSCYEYFDCNSMVDAGNYNSIEECETALKETFTYFGISSVDEMCYEKTIPAGTPVLYRIVGVFKDVELEDGTKRDLVKVVRNESIGSYSWDTSSLDVNGGDGVNDWTNADLMKLLNTGYESNTDFDETSASILVNNSLYWNSGNGTCYIKYENTTTTCDFTNIGISNKAKNNIQSVKWKIIAGNLTLKPSELYNLEANQNINELSNYTDRSNYWNGNIALISLSDYAFASDLNSCNQTLEGYSDEACISTNWISSNIKEQWTLSIAPEKIVFSIINSRPVTTYSLVPISGVENAFPFFGCSVRPTFYLDPELLLVSGEGTRDNPYVL